MASSNITVTVRIDEDVKEQADELFEDLGLSFTTAINVFVRQCLREGRIPFEIGRGSVAQKAPEQ